VSLWFAGAVCCDCSSHTHTHLPASTHPPTHPQGHELQAQLAEARAAADALQQQLEAAADARQELQQAAARLTAQAASLKDEVEREKATSNAYIEGGWRVMEGAARPP
jgi:hypothetical protein